MDGPELRGEDARATPEAIDHALQEAVASLAERVVALDASIAYHEARLAELRAARKKVERVQQVVNPVAKETKVRRPFHDRSPMRSNQAKRDQLRDYVREHPGEDLSVSRMPGVNGTTGRGWNGISRDLLRTLFRELADEGTIRLDRIGSGRSQVYRLVERE